eukprot:scaffold19722_cov38-Phaeocystis_antarctica.AAC.1
MMYGVCMRYLIIYLILSIYAVQFTRRRASPLPVTKFQDRASSVVPRPNASARVGACADITMKSRALRARRQAGESLGQPLRPGCETAEVMECVVLHFTVCAATCRHPTRQLLQRYAVRVLLAAHSPHERWHLARLACPACGNAG